MARRTPSNHGSNGTIICRSIPSSIGDGKKLYVFIDETGDLGSIANNRFYIICACLVSDPVEFANPVVRMNASGEFHAHKNPEKAPDIAKQAMSSVLRIYHVALIKNEDHNPPSPIRHMAHTRMLQMVADRILSDIPNDLDVTVDSTGMIPGTLVQGIFKKNSRRGNRYVEVTVKSSAKIPGMQSQDAITWINGQMYNGNYDHSYIIMSRMHTVIVSRAEWLERIHDDYTDTIISEDEELHMLRWEYGYYFPEKCYQKNQSNDNRLNGYPLDWNDFILWAYRELSSNHSWPEPMPDFETFRREHPLPQRYRTASKSVKGGRTEHANHVHSDVYKSHALANTSTGKYLNSSKSNQKARTRQYPVRHVSERTKQGGSHRRDSSHSRK